LGHSQKKEISSEIPDTCARNSEIIDIEKYRDFIAEFLKEKITNHEECFIFLDPQLTYEEKFPLDKSKTAEREKAEKLFSACIPLAKKDLIQIKKTDGNFSHIIATNKAFFLPILELCKSQNIRVTGVIPLSIFEKASTYNRDRLEKFLREKNKIRTTNFLDFLDVTDIVSRTHNENFPLVASGNPEETDDSPSQNEIEHSKKQTTLLVFSLIALGASIVYACINLGIINLNSTALPAAPASTMTEEKKESISKSTLENSTTEKKSSPLHSADYTVNIFYKTSSTDKANGFKKSLNDLGIEHVTMNIVDQKTALTPGIFFSINIEKTDIDTIYKSFSSLLKVIKKIPNNLKSDTDITIITGK